MAKFTVDVEDVKDVAIKTGIVLASYSLFVSLKRRYFDSNNYKLVGHVSDIMQFPVKGVRGNHLKQATVTNRGIISDGIFDRSFVIYHEVSKEMCNSKLPYSFHLVKIQVRITEGGDVVLSAPGFQDIKIEPTSSEMQFPVNIYGSDANNLFDCGDKVAEWSWRLLPTT